MTHCNNGYDAKYAPAICRVARRDIDEGLLIVVAIETLPHPVLEAIDN